MLIPGIVPASARIARSADAVIPVLPLAEAVAVRAVAGRRTLPLYVCDLRLADRPASRVVERIAAISARAAIASSRRFCALTDDYAAASRVVGRYADRALEVRPPVDVDAFPHLDRASARDRLGIHLIGTRRRASSAGGLLRRGSPSSRRPCAGCATSWRPPSS